MNAPGKHIHGWMSDEELAWLHDTAKTMGAVVEVGCFLGRGTFALCTGCAGDVIAIDHFKGSVEHKDEDCVKGGTMFEDFMWNLKRFKNLSVLRMSSVLAASFFADKSIDMVFIDGSHDYESVSADIKAWKPKARRLVSGHDYQGSYEGVRRAVDENFKDRILTDRIWETRV